MHSEGQVDTAAVEIQAQTSAVTRRGIQNLITIEDNDTEIDDDI